MQTNAHLAETSRDPPTTLISISGIATPRGGSEIETQSTELNEFPTSFSFMFRIVRKLSFNESSEVQVVQHHWDGQYYTMKRVLVSSSMAALVEERILAAWQETRILATSCAPNVVKYYNSWIEFDVNNPSLASVVIQMEYCPMSLFTWLRRRKLVKQNHNRWPDRASDERNPFSITTSIPDTLIYFEQLLTGMAYLHGLRLVHRDIRPGVVFFGQDRVLKIGDFGVSNRDCLSISNDILIQSRYRDECSDPFASDIYSLGVVAVEMFSSPKTEHQRNEMYTSFPNVLESCWDGGEAVADFVSLATGPRHNRPSITMLVDAVSALVRGGLDQHEVAELALLPNSIGPALAAIVEFDRLRLCSAHKSEKVLDFVSGHNTFETMFSRVRLLGRGATANVWLVRHRWDGELYAIKKMWVPRKRAEKIGRGLLRAWRETRIMAQIGSSSGIVRYFGSWVEQDPLDSFRACVVIQMEYCPQTLYCWLRERVGVDGHATLNYYDQILAGTEYLHSIGVTHRDLKPSNIFFDSVGRIKIGDLGLASVSCNQPMWSYGSELYMDPIVDYSTPTFMEMDVYSLGIILGEMFIAPSTEMERSKLIQKFPILDCWPGTEGVGVASIVQECIGRRFRRPTVAQLRAKVALFASSLDSLHCTDS